MLQQNIARVYARQHVMESDWWSFIKASCSRNAEYLPRWENIAS